jgi:hypothetical protein
MYSYQGEGEKKSSPPSYKVPPHWSTIEEQPGSARTPPAQTSPLATWVSIPCKPTSRASVAQFSIPQVGTHR